MVHVRGIHFHHTEAVMATSPVILSFISIQWNPLVETPEGSPDGFTHGVTMPEDFPILYFARMVFPYRLGGF